MLLHLIIPFIVLLSGVNAECPDINDMPVLNDAGDQFYCAFNWYSDHDPWDNENALDACTSPNTYHTYMDGDDYDTGHDHDYYDFGGTIVKAGCTLSGYENEHFQDDANEYRGPRLFPTGCPYPDHLKCNREMDNNLDHWGWSSFRCRCDQEPIRCEPSDNWVIIMECDNLENDNSAKCSYTKTIGTTWTSEVSNSMSIDSTIEESMSAAFFKFFEDDIGISVTTGYDWTHTSSEARSETETFHVETTVDAHSLLIIYGAWGECGDNVVKTEKFKLTSIDANGNVIKQTFEYMNGNKTIVTTN